MTSGVGLYSAKGRCHEYWMRVIVCNNNTSFPQRDCVNDVEDYLECLHHKKEVKGILYNF